MSKHHHRLDARRWAQARKACLDRDGWRCTECGKAGKLEAHHLVPVSEAPELAYELDNLATLCVGCHVELHHPALPGEREWRALIAEIAAGGV